MMKSKIVLSVFFLLGTFMLHNVQAQLTTPAPSPLCELTQKVGLGEVKVVYSRPSAKGREVMGELVPYDKIWRTGANQRTQIHFSEKVELQGTEVSAGKYAMLTIPGEEKWEIILSETTSGSPMELAEDEKTVRFSAPVKTIDMMVETFTIMIGDIRDDAATINLMWENTIVPIEMSLKTDEKVMASIDQVMAGPSQGDYFQAASYYYAHDKDMNQALEWVNKSMNENEERYWVVTLKARILKKMGKNDEAVTTAQEAMKLAEAGGNADYVKINKDLIASMQ